MDTVSGASWQIFDGADPCEFFDGNRTGGSGPFALINSNCDSNFFEPEDTYLVTRADRSLVERERRASSGPTISSTTC